MFIRYVVLSSLAVIALAVAALGVTQNARYGAWLDAAAGAQTVTIFGLALGGFGVTFAVLNAFKVLAPPAIIEAWRRGNRGIAATCAVGFLGLAVMSIWNATALQTIARDDKGARQAIESQRLAALKAELAEVEVQSKALGEARLTGEIEAALAAMRIDRRWSSSNDCRDATASASRTFCSGYQREFGELTRANTIEQSRAKIERLRGEIAEHTTVGALQQSDPELQRLAEATGLDAASVGWWRALFFAVTFELIEASALTLVWAVRPQPNPNSAATSVPGRTAAPLQPMPAPAHPLVMAPAALPEVLPEAAEEVVPEVVPRLGVEVIPKSASMGAVVAPKKSSLVGGASILAFPRKSGLQGRVRDDLRDDFEGRVEGSLALITEHPELVPENSSLDPSSTVPFFASEHLRRERSGRTSADEMWQAYEGWCAQRGVEPVSRVRFGTAIRELGHGRTKSCGRMYYTGVELA